MFAGAAREAVFSNPEVIRRIQRDFIPVALKAALVNNPPPGLEGTLYGEIGRSRPAPQGICVANSACKVLAWALMFDDDDAVVAFLDHCLARFEQFPAADEPVAAERFMTFPSNRMDDVPDTRQPLHIPDRHAAADRCPAVPELPAGTLVGTIVGRALDADGEPLADTLRQEHYMEARFHVPPPIQRQLAAALRDAGDERFALPDSLARLLVSHAYLGQLDVNPLGDVPGAQNDDASWRFFGRRVDAEHAGLTRVSIEGESDVSGSQASHGRRTDGRLWDHTVRLTWEGFVELEDGRLTRLALLASGSERLRWGNPQWLAADANDVARLPAGHLIDLDCGVRYGLFAEAGAEE